MIYYSRSIVPPRNAAFTLIELSIVLVIIGLVVSGILVGRDLIAASYVRAQLSQMERYQSAVNTFRGKYNYLPGDIPDPLASTSGLIARGTTAGTGDGNGIMEGWNGTTDDPLGMGVGENTVFWRDLSTMKLIEGNFATARSNTFTFGTPITPSTTPVSLDNLLPAAKIGQGNYVYVYSNNNVNYFGLSAALYIGSGVAMATTSGLTTLQANAIDTKIDDGKAKSGRVLGNSYIGYGIVTSPPYGSPDTATTCYNHITQGYSIITNPGLTMCALSFQFQ